MVIGEQVERQNARNSRLIAPNSIAMSRRTEDQEKDEGKRVESLPRGTARSIERLPRKQARALVAATFFDSMLSSSSVIN